MISGSIRRFLRIFSAEKHYSFLNIVGLSLGMACSILLALYLEHELTFDRHNTAHQNIYRVNHQIDATNNVTLQAQTSHFLGPLLIRDYPQIESYVSFRPESPNATLLKYQNQSYYVDDLFIADNSVFDIFTHEIVYGEPSQALLRPNTIAINRSLAERLFSGENPVGRTVTTGVVDYQVTLVFGDLPDNSHFKYSALIANAGNFAPSADALANRRGNLWNLNGYTYVRMNPATQVDGSEVFVDFYTRMMADVTRPGYTAQFFLEPLADIHLSSVALQDFPRGNTYYLYALSVVAVLVLISACFNYINLATARAFGRSKEIAIRKILGADRKILITQFIAESMLYAFIALFVAVMLVKLVLAGSADINLFGRDFDPGFWRDPWALVALLVLGLAVGAMAGI
ncbi:MAG: ABC transporter permease [Proteobacteria bacterium]|nr:ABC transporter permease [Pseudomonadota bacterium]